MIAIKVPTPETRSSVRDCVDRLWLVVQFWSLALLAGATWFLTVGALGLDHFTGTDHRLIVSLFAIAYLSGGTLAARTALGDLRHRIVNVDLLMVLAAVGAAAIDAWAEGAILLALFATSNALEHHALDRTRNAVQALMDLSPDTATRIVDGMSEIVPTSSLMIGDRVLIRPGEKIPADSEVVLGESDIDQSSITGESIPVIRRAGDHLYAGTINGKGALESEVIRRSTESTLAKIVLLVERAQSQKSRAERFTDAFEGPYALGVIASAVLFAAGSLVWGVPANDAFYRAMTLLVVASPCALVISTPAATLSVMANAARNGVLVKGGAYLDVAGAVHTIAFDKTGTLTTGRPEVTQIVSGDGVSEDEVLGLAASVEVLSEHPLGEAIVRAARGRNIALRTATSFVSKPGKGLAADVSDVHVTIGNPAHAVELGIVVPDVLQAAIDHAQGDGKTAMIVGRGGEAIGVIAAADTIRPEAPAAIAALRALGAKRLVMLTGDHQGVADAIARQVGIDEVHASLLPEAKLALVESFKTAGRVAMVGDGVNDAPALASVDVGIAMGSRGTDVALETADIVLMGDDLRKLVLTVALGRRMRRVIRVNIAFSLAVIAALVLSTLAVGIPLPLGVVGHEGSTILVVLSGLRLLGFRLGDQPAGLFGRARNLNNPRSSSMVTATTVTGD